MQLSLKRTTFSSKSTIGDLSVDGVFFTHILEDVVREVPGQPVSSWKIKNETAIPRGTYEIGWHDSPHFGRVLPHLLNVPGYEYVLIHPGNKAADTEGCLLVGDHVEVDFIGESRVAFNRLFPLIKAAKDKGENVTITIA